MNPNELLLQKLINDPKLLKTIEKLVAGRASVQKEKKLKEAGTPAHVNRVVIICKLCKSIEVVYIRMDWDHDDKIYRNGCYSMDNRWPELPLFNLSQRKPSCKICKTELLSETKETLIGKLIALSERNG